MTDCLPHFSPYGESLDKKRWNKFFWCTLQLSLLLCVKINLFNNLADFFLHLILQIAAKQHLIPAKPEMSAPFPSHTSLSLPKSSRKKVKFLGTRPNYTLIKGKQSMSVGSRRTLPPSRLVLGFLLQKFILGNFSEL